jgi:hypothetical protein
MRIFIICTLRQEDYVKKNGMAGHVACIGWKRNACKLVVGSPEEKRLLRRPKQWWDDNIKIYSLGIGLGGLVWFGLIGLRMVTGVGPL